MSELYNTKLFKLLQLFDKEELQGIQLFAKIFPDKDKQTSKLLALLIKECPAYTITKEKLYALIYPEKKQYNDKTMRSLFTNTKRLIVKYLSCKQLDKMEPYQKWMAMEYLLHEQTFTHWDIVAKDFERQLANKELQYPEQLHLKFRLEEYRLNEQSIQKNRGKQSNLQTLNNALDDFYLAMKLRYWTVMLNRTLVLGDSYELTFLAELKEKMATMKVGSSLFFKSYYGLLQLLTQEANEEECINFNDWLMRDGIVQERAELRLQFTVLLNICLQKVKEGKINFCHLALRIYEFLLEKKIILVQGQQLSPHHLRNMIRMALIAERLDLADEFLKKYGNNIHEKWQELLLAFNKASLLFERGEFNKAYDCLGEVYHQEDWVIDVFYNLHYRTLYVQILFELEDWEALETNLQTLKLFTQRNKNLGVFNKAAYHNFGRLLSKLLNKKQGKRIRAKDLGKEIEDCDFLVKRRWLMDKVKGKSSR